MTENAHTHTYTIPHRYATRRFLGQYQLADVTPARQCRCVLMRCEVAARNTLTPTPRPRVYTIQSYMLQVVDGTDGRWVRDMGLAGLRLEARVEEGGELHTGRRGHPTTPSTHGTGRGYDYSTMLEASPLVRPKTPAAGTRWCHGGCWKVTTPHARGRHANAQLRNYKAYRPMCDCARACRSVTTLNRRPPLRCRLENLGHEHRPDIPTAGSI